MDDTPLIYLVQYFLLTDNLISETFWFETLGPLFNTLILVNKECYSLLHTTSARFRIQIGEKIRLSLPTNWLMTKLLDISPLSFATKDVCNRTYRQVVYDSKTGLVYGENRYRWKKELEFDGDTFFTKYKMDVDVRYTNWCEKHNLFTEMRYNDGIQIPRTIHRCDKIDPEELQCQICGAWMWAPSRLHTPTILFTCGLIENASFEGTVTHCNHKDVESAAAIADAIIKKRKREVYEDDEVGQQPVSKN